MTKPVCVALGLWAILALVVFNVTFDWQTRAAGLGFADAQMRRHASGLPVATINEGFRPLVRSAALDSSVWLGLIFGAGAIATATAVRTSKKSNT